MHSLLTVKFSLVTPSLRTSIVLFSFIIITYFYSTGNWYIMDFSNETQAASLLRTVLRQRVFHLDLKGAPPRPKYYAELFPLLKEYSFTHVLIEYEDMFPYSGQLSMLAGKNSYDENTISYILKMAADNNLSVIPLVQTFGHMEFVLKHPAYAMLRENPTMADTICPSDSRSIALIREMLQQIRRLHPHSDIIHLGADEAYQIAKDERCLHRLETRLHNSTDRLKLDHISNVAKLAKDLKFEKIWVWNDMFDQVNASLMKEFRLNSLIVPVVWGYAENVQTPGYFPDGMFERYSEVFDELIFASAFKGANGQTQCFMKSSRYMANLISYYDLYKNKESLLSNRLSGIILTGWQRYNHLLPLCELLPVSIPTLVKQALYLENWCDPKAAVDFHDKSFLKKLGINDSILSSDILQPILYHNQIYHPPIETLFQYGKFPGVDLLAKVEELRVIKWKANTNGFYTDELVAQLNKLKAEIHPILNAYFYEDTVEEWMTQNMDTTTQPIHG